jgi:drug/metabolite transporter (DMT)-like permease
VLAELPGTPQLLGGILILAGIVIIQQREQRGQLARAVEGLRKAASGGT